MPGPRGAAFGQPNAADVGAESVGASAPALAAHVAAADPHPGYLTPAEGNAAYEALGAATSALAAHLAASDPHPTYLIQTEGDARYAQLTPLSVGGIAALTSDSAALTTADTAVLVSPVIPAGAQTVGTVFKVIAQATNSSALGVCNMKVHFGTAGTVADATVVSCSSGLVVSEVWFTAILTCRATGVSGTIKGSGSAISAVLPQIGSFSTAAVQTNNTTVANKITVSGSTTTGTLVFTSVVIYVDKL